MLRFVLGRTGSGKTHFARRRLSEICENPGSTAIILVPEQYSFETERALLKTALATNRGNYEVLSFSSLCRRIFEEYGKGAKPALTGGARAIVMALALSECSDMLSVYKKPALSADMIKSLLDISSEFNQCAVTPDDLSAVSASLPDGSLKHKTAEFANIFSVYNTLVAAAFNDDQTSLQRILSFPETADYFTGKTVIIDGFKGFTAIQLKAMELIIKSADDVMITLCTDSLQHSENPIGLFNNVKLTAGRIAAAARKNGVAVASPVVLSRNVRTKNNALLLLEEYLSDNAGDALKEDVQGITVCDCGTSYDEADYTARTICKIVREKGLRYRDIAVIARNIADYSGAVKGAFAKYGLPYHMDMRRPVTHEPLMLFIQNAFSAVLEGFDADDIFAALKTELCPVSRDDIALLENYTFLWGIKGNRFNEDFSYNPDGICDGFSQKQKDTLSDINRLRILAFKPFFDFGDTLKQTHSGADISKAVFEFLAQCGVKNGLRRLSALAKQEGRHDDADSLVRSYNLVCEILQQLFDATENRDIGTKKYAELFSLAVKNSDMGQVPQGLDEILVGSADRMRPAEPEIVFIVGANEGVFPLAPSSGGLLTDSERKKLINMGLELSDRCEDKVNDENFLFYSSVCAASQGLYITYCRTSPSGEPKSPSLPVCRLREYFGAGVVRFEDTYKSADGIDAFERAQAHLPALETVAGLLRGTSAASAAAGIYLEKYLDGQKYHILKNACYPRGDKLAPETAQTLFGSDMRVSPSGVEVFFKCRFWYFCRFGLRVKPRETADLNVMLKGTIVHHVLERLFNKYNKRRYSELSEKVLKSEIHELVTGYVDDYMGGFAEKSARFIAALKRIERQLYDIIDRMMRELLAGQYEVAACEQRIGMGENIVKPMVYTLSNGSRLWVEGVADRIDVYSDGLNRYFRVIDYKTGKKEFLLDELLFGLGLQMLIYMYSVESGGSGVFGDCLVPSGILYVPAKSFSVRQDEAGDDGDIKDKLDKEAKMSGVILEDKQVIEAMGAGQNNGFLPFSFNKDGTMRSGSPVAGKAFFESMKKKISALLTEMGELLQNGDIPADPLDPLKGDACEYCDYGSVCPHSGNMPHRKVYKLTEEQKKQIRTGGDKIEK